MKATTSNPRALFYPTPLKRAVLRELAEYECLTITDLSLHIYGDTKQSHRFAIQRALWTLDDQTTKLLYGDSPNEYGSKPYVYGLSSEGVFYALHNFPDTDPVLLSKDHSILTIGHEIARASIHFAIKKLCEERGCD